MIGNRLLLLFLTATQLSGCGPAIEAAYILNRTDVEAYDDGICKHGEQSKPGDPTRYGCVNNKSEWENKMDYYKYKDDRENYLNEK